MMLINPLTRQVLNENEKGCNQYTGPNCGGRVRKAGWSSPTARGTRSEPVLEDYGFSALTDSNGDLIYRGLHPSKEVAVEDALKLAKTHKLGVNKPKFKETGYFKDRRGVILQHGEGTFDLGEEETGGEEFPARTNLSSTHLQRMLEKIRSKK